MAAEHVAHHYLPVRYSLADCVAVAGSLAFQAGRLVSVLIWSGSPVDNPIRLRMQFLWVHAQAVEVLCARVLADPRYVAIGLYEYADMMFANEDDLEALCCTRPPRAFEARIRPRSRVSSNVRWANKARLGRAPVNMQDLSLWRPEHTARHILRSRLSCCFLNGMICGFKSMVLTCRFALWAVG